MSPLPQWKRTIKPFNDEVFLTSATTLLDLLDVSKVRISC